MEDCSLFKQSAIAVPTKGNKMSQANPLPAELSAQLSALSPHPTALALRLLLGAKPKRIRHSGRTICPASSRPGSQPPRVSPFRPLPKPATHAALPNPPHAKLQAAGVEACLSSAGDFKSKTLPDEDIVFLLPPPRAKANHPKKPCPCTNSSTAKKPTSANSPCRLRPWRPPYPTFCQSRQRL